MRAAANSLYKPEIKCKAIYSQTISDSLLAKRLQKNLRSCKLMTAFLSPHPHIAIYLLDQFLIFRVWLGDLKALKKINSEMPNFGKTEEHF